MKRKRPVSVVLTVLATLAGDMGSAAMASDIVEQFRAEREKNRKADIDVAHLVRAQIPVGTEADAARKILEKNGFQIYRRDLADGSHRLSGTRKERPFLTIEHDEYRIVLTIVNGRVTSIFAKIFLHAL